MDISGAARTGADIFRLVADIGPVTLYSASTRSRFALGTLHRHFKEMLRAGTLAEYDDLEGRRKRKPYGPTVLGFVHYSRIDDKISNKLENYFLLWVEAAEFRDDLTSHGFSAKSVAQDPRGSKDLFCKYVKYYSLIEEQLDNLRNNWNLVPRDLALFMGEVMLLTLEPSQFRTWKELYLKMPGLRERADSRIGHMQSLRSKMHRQLGR